MSRVGKAPISVPSGVNIEVSKGNLVTVKGPKGSISEQMDADLSIDLSEGVLSVSRPTDSKRHRSLNGLTRALLNNMVEGVSAGFTREMELVGVGYRVENKGQMLILTLGYSHPIYFVLPNDVKVETKMEKGQTPRILLQSHDKQLIGQICAKIRSFRKPEPYKGKGIRFVGEIIRRKAGKTAGKGGKK